jgi:hypothetical protein
MAESTKRRAVAMLTSLGTLMVLPLSPWCTVVEYGRRCIGGVTPRQALALRASIDRQAGTFKVPRPRARGAILKPRRA